MASYPGAFPSFTTKTDLVDTIHAEDVDDLQNEVIAIESAVGLNPALSTSPSSMGTFNPVSTLFASLGARLANVETGIVADSHTQYLRNTGGGVATTSSATVVPLTVQALSGQTADVFDVISPSGAIKYFKVDNGGTVWAGAQALPLGLIQTAKQTTNSSGLGSSEAMLGSLTCTITAAVGRVYRVTLNIIVGDANNVGTVATLRLRDGTTTSNTALSAAPSLSATVNSSGFGGTGIHYAWYLDNLAAGTHQLTPSVQPGGSGANFQLLAGPANPCVMWVEDIGT